MIDFCNNPFLVLGISADADMAVAKKVADRRLVELRLRGEQDSASFRQLEQAIEQLRDPVQRFRWGLFWPELTPEEAEAFRRHPVLSTVRAQPRQDVAEAYHHVCRAPSEAVRVHNLGTLALVRAIAETEHAQKGTPDDIRDDLACVAYWREAFSHLRDTVDSDEFWLRQKMRAKAIDDPRLDTPFVDRCRVEFLRDVLAPLGQVIRSALLAGPVEVASAYVGLIRDAGLDPSFVDDTLSDVYKPLADRVEKHVEDLARRLQEIDDTADNAAPYRSLLEDFKRQVAPDLDAMLAVGDLPGYAEEHARDTSAEFLRELSVAAWNATGDKQVSDLAISYAVKYADAASLKSKLKQDRAQITEIAGRNAAMASVQPLLDELQALKGKQQFVAMLPVIDRIIVALPEDQKARFRQIRLVTQENAAATLFKQGVEEAGRGRRSVARTHFRMALEYAHKAESIALIEAALRECSIGGTGLTTGDRGLDGCAVSLVILLVAFGVLMICSGILGAL